MVNRIREIRNATGLSQTDFGKRLGVSRDVINNLELNRVELKEHMIKLICKEFKINYMWLKYGQGDPKTDTPEDIFEEIRAEYDLSDDDVDILKEYSEMNSDERAGLRRYIKSLLKAKKEEG